MTEDEIIGWHHQLNGHESKQASGVGDGQQSLACYNPLGHKELDMTELTEALQKYIERIFPDSNYTYPHYFKGGCM